jgi:hypothetical protein
MSQIPPSSPPPPPSPGQGGSSRLKKSPNPAEITVLAGAAVVLIFSFLSFYEVSAFGHSVSQSAWGTGLFPLATLIVVFAVIAGVLVLLPVVGVTVPDRVATFTRGQILLLCGAFATIQSLGYLIVDKGGLDFGIGFWFMLLGSIAVLVGAVMLFRESPNA